MCNNGSSRIMIGLMSSHNRQRFPLFQVQCRFIFDSAVLYQALCRVTLDTSFRCSRSNVDLESTALSTARSNVESHSTALSSVPGPMSSHTRQRFPLFSGPVSSHTRHRCLLYQVQCRTQINVLFYSVISMPFLSFCN